MTIDRSQPITIALCGATGTGKSTFINDASGGDLPVGHAQNSCTENIAFAPPFEVDGVEVRLIDTPGFDDTTMSDTEILKRIGAFLQVSHMENQYLSGLIYMHRITDNRVGGVSRRNFRVFRELVGPGALVNVVIVTNMWRDPIEPAELARERDLQENPMFFQPVLEKGARMARYVRSQAPDSAHDIIRMFMENVPKPTYLGEALADRTALEDTNPGKVLNEELQKLLDKQKAELDELRAELAQVKESERELREELKADLKETQDKYDETKAQIASLLEKNSKYKAKAKKFREENAESRGKIAELRNELDRLKEEIKVTKDPEEVKFLARQVNKVEKAIYGISGSVWNTISSWFS
ncbi:50S ribosome-binding GTPase [Ceratobasidium sp. AG-Ba]|nr:50S ribosome-binding GTPase [Ceratobasidium sp. AG-Ba]